MTVKEMGPAVATRRAFLSGDNPAEHHMFWELLGAYPMSFVASVIFPVLAGVAAICGSFAGYENLKHQFDSDQQAKRIEEGVSSIRADSTAHAATLRLLESYEKKLTAAGKRDTVLTALINQYQRLSQANTLFGQFGHRDASQDQGKIAATILDILNKDVVQTTVRTDLPGQPLQIEIAPNSFRVIFAVPMRITPRLTFTGLPDGVSASVSDASEISFTVTFLPLTTPVTRFGMIADAEL
jgi:hypothetical protein